MQEIRSECFVIGRDSNWGFGAAGRKYSLCWYGWVLCTRFIDSLDSKTYFINFTRCFEVVYISAREIVTSFVLLVETEMSLQCVFMVFF